MLLRSRAIDGFSPSRRKQVLERLIERLYLN